MIGGTNISSVFIFSLLYSNPSLLQSIHFQCRQSRMPYQQRAITSIQRCYIVPVHCNVDNIVRYLLKMIISNLLMQLYAVEVSACNVNWTVYRTYSAFHMLKTMVVCAGHILIGSWFKPMFRTFLLFLLPSTLTRPLQKVLIQFEFFWRIGFIVYVQRINFMDRLWRMSMCSM